MVLRFVLGCAALALAMTGQALVTPHAAQSAPVVDSSGPVQGPWAPRAVARAESVARPPGKIGDRVRGWRLTKRNIGLAAYGLSCNKLRRYRGPARPAAGTRIKRRLITKPMDLSAGNIVIARSCIRPTDTGSHNSYLVTTTTCASSCYATRRGGVVIRDSEISGWALPASEVASSCAFLGVADLYRNLMHGMGSGICYFETGHRHSATAEHNYVTDLRQWGEAHREAATVRDFRDTQNPKRQLVLRYNRFNASGDYVTAGLFIQPTWVSIYHLRVIGNLIEGEGYNIYVSGSIPGEPGTYDDIRSINNRFRSTGWGESAVTDGPGWDIWRDNYVYNPRRKGARGRIVRP